MKSFIIKLCIVLILLNVFIGFISTAYSTEKVIANSLIILSNSALLFYAYSTNIKDAFKSSITFLTTPFAIAELVLISIGPDTYQDNNYLIACVGIFVLHLIILFSITSVSRKDANDKKRI
jgi:hypothetical protein